LAELLAGSWESLSLAALLQLLESEEITGWLALGEVGRVGLSKGQVVAAEAGELRGRDALRTLFVVPGQGQFQVTGAAEVPGQSLGQTMGLIMDGIRLSDEWHRLMGMVLEGVGELGALPAGVIEGLDGQRCVLDVVLGAQVPPVRVIDPLLTLLDQRHIRLVRTDPDVMDRWLAYRRRSSEPDPLEGLDSFECLSAGRRLLRSGDLDGAESAFRRAISLAPDDRIASQNLRRLLALRGTNPR